MCMHYYYVNFSLLLGIVNHRNDYFSYELSMNAESHDWQNELIFFGFPNIWRLKIFSLIVLAIFDESC